MVSFQCESCGDVMTKGKIKNHLLKCRTRSFSCLDCSVVFQCPSRELDGHTSCVSEAQKYQGKLYKGKKQQQPQQPQQAPQQQAEDVKKVDGEDGVGKKRQQEEQEEGKKKEEEEEKVREVKRVKSDGGDGGDGVVVEVDMKMLQGLGIGIGEKKVKLKKVISFVMESDVLKRAVEEAVKKTLIKQRYEGKLRFEDKKIKPAKK